MFFCKCIHAVHGFYRKSNEVVLDFDSVTSDVKSSLFSTYCLDAYRSSLWNYSSQCVKTFYIACRKVVGRICFLPYSTHFDTLTTLNLQSLLQRKECVLMLLLRMFLYFYLAINILLLTIISGISHINTKCIGIIDLASL